MKRGTRFRSVLLLFAIGVCPAAFANAGTPLMFFRAMHLVVGNSIIGLCEGLALALLFRLPRLKTIGLLILANYASAWVGYSLIPEVSSKFFVVDIHNLKIYFWALAVLTFGLTILLELPFVFLAVLRQENRIHKAILGSMLIQTASYCLIFGFFWQFSGTSLITDGRVVNASSMNLPGNVVIYYISQEDGDVYKKRLADDTPQRVFDLSAKDAYSDLYFKKNALSGLYALIAYVDPPGNQNESEKDLGIEHDRRSVPVWRSTQSIYSAGGRGGFEEVPVLGSAQSSPWEFKVGLYPIEGLKGVQHATNKRVHLAFETVWAERTVRDAFHLPTDKVLFRLVQYPENDAEICIYDPETNTIALIAKGRGPVAVIEEEPAP